jgi:methylenetetrahydrofolate dehydrogenase (NADP+)/methenyltetrahydrofolate cyclohydrolase
MTYVKNKHRACQEVGITTRDFKLSSNISQEELNKIIDELNKDPSVHGILIQLPLPNQLDEFIATSRVSPLKDVDGLTPHNAGLLAMGKALLIACTPSGIMEMFDFHKIDLEGKTVILINRSNLVGKPLYHLLLARDATVITCHSKSKNLSELCKTADVIITAVGNRERFTLSPDMIKTGSVIIDVAISRRNDKLLGDSDFEEIIQKAAYATPVPGGVGPLTVAMLLKNTITAASLSSQIGKQS